MASKENSDKTRYNAIYIMGFNDALVAMYSLRELGVVPALQKIQTEEYKSAVNTVAKILNGCIDNPFDLLEMNKYVETLDSSGLPRRLDENI